MTMLRKPLLIAAATLLLAGCDANWSLQNAVDAAEEAKARAKEKCTEARSNRDSYFANRADAQREVSALEAEIQFEQIAAKGEAGTSEAYRLLQRRASDPYYEQGRKERLEAARSLLAELTAEPEYELSQVRIRCGEYAQASELLRKKQAELKKARRG